MVEDKTVIDEIEQRQNEVNRVLVSSFLQKEIGLTTEEEQDLSKCVFDYGGDIHTLSVECDLRERFDKFKEIGISPQNIKENPELILMEIDVLTARINFFLNNELELGENAENVVVSSVEFAEKYGERIVERGGHTSIEYAKLVREKVIELYLEQTTARARRASTSEKEGHQPNEMNEI